MNLTALAGKKIFVRTVTNYYTGRLMECGEFLRLEEATWIADTGRFADALKTGNLEEVEPYPAECWISAGSVIDISEWHHDLPRTQK